MNVQRTAIRSLSGPEKRAVPAGICAGLDLGAIEIHQKPWTPFTPSNFSVVRGWKIFYPNDPGPSQHLSHLAHLVHEVVHVWQYQVLGIGLYSPRWLDRRYHYHLNPGDRFLSFGLEQQAAIAEDGFRVRHGLDPRWAQNNPSLDLLDRTVHQCGEADALPVVWRA